MTKKGERKATGAAERTPKPYSKPTLNKGPVLSRITAEGGGSMTDTLVT
ncbi:MAG: hypothetical protein Q8P46_17955 [Hyphomicrobiales bacterium]|nr:hypothetical protein [Hyphomicrobiales bacterium]